MTCAVRSGRRYTIREPGHRACDYRAPAVSSAPSMRSSTWPGANSTQHARPPPLHVAVAAPSSVNNSTHARRTAAIQPAARVPLDQYPASPTVCGNATARVVTGTRTPPCTRRRQAEALPRTGRDKPLRGRAAPGRSSGDATRAPRTRLRHSLEDRRRPPSRLCAQSVKSDVIARRASGTGAGSAGNRSL